MTPALVHSSFASEADASNTQIPTTTPATIKTPLPNPSLQVTADHNLKLQEAAVYAPGRGEVLLHIKATCVCGSDIHFWKAGRIGSLVVKGDCILGHEAS